MIKLFYVLYTSFGTDTFILIFVGLHLILCYYALGEKEKMKRGFQMLLECPLNIDDDEKYNTILVSECCDRLYSTAVTKLLDHIAKHLKRENEMFYIL